jgi:hypothetical protein
VVANDSVTTFFLCLSTEIVPVLVFWLGVCENFLKNIAEFVIYFSDLSCILN